MRYLDLSRTTALFLAAISGVACGGSEPEPPVDVAITIATTGNPPAITTLSVSIDGHAPRPIVIGTPLTLQLSPRSHSFHLALTPHNCPASNRPDPYVVTIETTPDPFPVDFALDCL